MKIFQTITIQSPSAHGATGSQNTSDTGDPKTAFLFRSCAPGSHRRTFAVQLHVLARILYHDEEISIRARYAEKNLLIVPFFPNSPDFRCANMGVVYLNLIKWLRVLWLKPVPRVFMRLHFFPAPGTLSGADFSGVPVILPFQEHPETVLLPAVSLSAY